MPLHDTFKKKGSDQRATAKVAPLRMPPSQEDIRFCMGQAVRSGRPSALSWRIDSETYILTVSSIRGSSELTWMLHVGDNLNSVVLWTYKTGDIELIHSFLAQLNDQNAPKAVIPDSLKPGPDKFAHRSNETDTSFPSPQEEFADKYEIISRVGSGGMGVIYKARRKDSQEIVALKLLHGHLLDDQENTKRFMQEASACSQLKHRNLISVYEYGVSRRGQPFMIMEYLEGQALSDIIQTEGKLELPRFINLFTQICDGLQCAHENGVVHRDVKPSNIMIVKPVAGARESAKVLDFGIAKFIVETEHKLTPTGNVIGSPSYIAPEQCAGGKADPRSDVYAIGCVMYEALAGHPPFIHESTIKVLLMQLGDPPPPLSSVCPEGTVPEDLEEIIMNCLEKDPEMRYSSASDLAAELWTIAALRSQGLSGEYEKSLSRDDNSAAAKYARSSKRAAKIESELDTSEIEDAVKHLESEPSELLSPYKEEDESEEARPSEVGFSEEEEEEEEEDVAGAFDLAERHEQENSHTEKTESPYQPVLTMRFRRARSTQDLDGIWEGINMALKIRSREQEVTVFLDAESTLLVMRMELVAHRFSLEMPVLKRMAALQGNLQQLLKAGGTILVSERWAKRGSDPSQLMPGVLLINDDEICDLIIDRRGSIIDF